MPSYGTSEEGSAIRSLGPIGVKEFWSTWPTGSGRKYAELDRSIPKPCDKFLLSPLPPIWLHVLPLQAPLQQSGPRGGDFGKRQFVKRILKYGVVRESRSDGDLSEIEYYLRPRMRVLRRLEKAYFRSS